MSDPAELSLLTQVAVFHNKRAFDKLVVKYQSPIRRFFLNQTGGDSQLSDDLAQDTFVKAYLNIGQFRGASSFSTWLYRIAYNVFYDYTRSHKLTEQIDQAVALRVTWIYNRHCPSFRLQNVPVSRCNSWKDSP